MNYRTTFDTTNLPANTKKNIKELNEVALQREKSIKSMKSEPTPKSPKSRDSSTHKKESNNNSDSDSDGEEETLMPKSNKDQSEKARKKAEWLELFV